MVAFVPREIFERTASVTLIFASTSSVAFMEKMACECSFEKYDKTNIITTITYFTAYTICYQYQNFIKEFDEVIVSGGGSHNKFILKTMREILGVPVLVQEDLGYSSDAKEAIYSFLAYEFSILLSRIYRLDKKTQKEKRKELMAYKWLLHYTHNPKVKIVAILNKIFGIRITEYMLKLYDSGK